ncbi:MAG: hypothetical protein ACRD6X_16770 [Pyrinomonadaceae bacterium]
MNFDFELYEEGQVGRTRDRVHVTLGKDSHIYFIGKAVEALGRPDGVALLFDRRRQVIGVMPSALNRNHAYRLRHKAGMGAGRVISAKNFCRHYAIRPEETLAFPDASVNKDGILVLDLHAVKGVKKVNSVQGKANSEQRAA